MFGRKKRSESREQSQAHPDTAWQSLRGENRTGAQEATATGPVTRMRDEGDQARRSGTAVSGDADTGGSAADSGHDRPASSYNTRSERPAPDHEDKAAKPTQLRKPSWIYTLKQTIREFGQDQCTDLAAALTYYAVLALFPALIALLSLLGVVGQADKSVEAVTKILGDLLTPSTVDRITPLLESLATSPGAGLTLIIGLLGALWSASGYVGAFSRAMNRIYEVAEGRPVWKLRPALLLITFVTIVLAAVALVILVVSGPLAQAIGDVIGLGDTALQVWNIAKWPVLLLIVVFIVALLYRFTPNVKQPKFRWISIGAFVAIVVWILASIGFALYIATMGQSSYSKTYGALAGVVIFLLWLWLTNLALLFGAELDSELERARELQAGIAAEETLQLPMRDDRNVKKLREKEEKAIAAGRALRASGGRSDGT